MLNKIRVSKKAVKSVAQSSSDPAFFPIAPTASLHCNISSSPMGGVCAKCTLKQTSSAESSSSSSKGSPGGSTSPSFRSISLASSGEPHNDSSPKSTAASGGWSPINRRSSSSAAPPPTGKPSAADCAHIIHYENDVLSLADERKHGEQAVVLIYGGPGSKKGFVAENLISTYGFNLLNCEDLILRRLPPVIERRARKDGLVFTPEHVMGGGCFDGECVNEDMKIMQNLLGDIKDDVPTWYTQGRLSEDPIHRLKMMMKDYPEELSLHWVIEQVADEIESKFGSKNQHMLVDLLPNFQFLLEIPNFAVGDCSQEMLWLERKFPCLFAMYLDASEEQSMVRVPAAQKLPTHKENEASCIKSEMDEAKKRQRKSVFQEVVGPHLRHFRRENRLVTVNVSSVLREHTWWHVNELFQSLLFVPRETHNKVVIFANGDQRVQVECSKNHAILKLQLDKNCYQSEDMFLHDFKEKLTASSSCNNALVVVCEVELAANLHMKQKKRIKFVENGDPFTRFVVREGNHCVVNYKGDTFKAISSPGNLVCCFPNVMDDTLCRQMAANATSIFQQRLLS